MEKFPPNIFENKELLNQGYILKLRQNHDEIVAQLMEYKSAIMESQVRLRRGDTTWIDHFDTKLQEHRRHSVIIINSIENALNNFLQTKNMGYIQNIKDQYRFLERNIEGLLVTKFSKVNKISQKVLRYIKTNQAILNKIEV